MGFDSSDAHQKIRERQPPFPFSLILYFVKFYDIMNVKTAGG